MNNNFDYIILAAEHGKLIKVKEVFAVEGTQKTIWAGFQFRTSDWDGMGKTVVFQKVAPRCAVENTPIHVVLGDDGICEIPMEVLKDEGAFQIGIFGVKDEQRLVTNFIRFEVKVGCYIDGSTPDAPTTSVYEQIISELAKKQPMLISGENVSIDSDNVISSRPFVVNASTHYDFPSIGEADVIYKAAKEEKIYQWDEEKLTYIVLCDFTKDVDLIYGGNANGEQNS